MIQKMTTLEETYYLSRARREKVLGLYLNAEIDHCEGPCPFLSCLEEEPHDHYICPNCGAVRFGNPLCNTCKMQHEIPLFCHICGKKTDNLRRTTHGAIVMWICEDH